MASSSPYQQRKSPLKKILYESAFEDDSGSLPNESQLVLICLDYLRDLRRAYEPKDLSLAEGLDADYISIAIYALSRAFHAPQKLKMSSEMGNDPWVERDKLEILHPDIFPIDPDTEQTSLINIPDIDTINKEILYTQDPSTILEGGVSQEEKKEDPTSWYEYDDNHVSNSHRFYPLDGLASGPTLRGPLTLGEIMAAGLAGLGAKNRLDAEKEMTKSPLFDQFVSAVRAKGFFADYENDSPCKDPHEEEMRQLRAAEVYEERYRKVIAKFRNKLAVKAQQDLAVSNGGSGAALSAAEKQRHRRQVRIDNARSKHAKWERDNSKKGSPKKATVPKAEDPGLKSVSPLIKNLMPSSPSSPEMSVAQSVAPPQENPLDVKEAEKLKTTGNKWMQKKEYEKAIESYTMALKLCPAGPPSHVYFSNRAAALLSMKKYEDAILDAERSLALKPNYGKAHARLGLAYFLLGNYRQAAEAYAISLKYEPNNKSNQSYLEKAKKKLRTEEKREKGEYVSSNFSVVSEWENSEYRNGGSVVADEEAERQFLIDQKEAESFKHKGNSHMASREYQLATDSYSEAIRLCPDGLTSHVYFSNRAAALCYLERYTEAELDSEQSLALKPNYGKAHARLGLARFFMEDYQGAVDAYTRALEFDPKNAASKSYLAKAKARLQAGQRNDQKDAVNDRGPSPGRIPSKSPRPQAFSPKAAKQQEPSDIKYSPSPSKQQESPSSPWAQDPTMTEYADPEEEFRDHERSRKSHDKSELHEC